MRVFVTGGSGFVGGHLVERLAKDGHDVRAMARSEKSGAVVRGFGATPVTAELGALTAEHLSGCDAVVHCAAYVEEWGTREQFWQANVEGTRNALEAARAAGVKRFVHVGTEAALFDGHDLIGIDERQPYPAHQRFLYSETKAEAEKLVLAANGPELTTISVRPRFVWGPRDTSVLPAVLRMAEAGRFSWVDHGRHRTSSCHVANLVEALVLALSRGEGGRSYFICDPGERSMKETLSGLASTRGVALGERSAPGWLLRAVAATVEAPYRLFGIRSAPPLTRFAIAMMSASVTVRDDRARADLGYAPVITWEAGLEALRSEASAR